MNFPTKLSFSPEFMMENFDQQIIYVSHFHQLTFQMNFTQFKKIQIHFSFLKMSMKI